MLLIQLRLHNTQHPFRNETKGCVCMCITIEIKAFKETI